MGGIPTAVTEGNIILVKFCLCHGKHWSELLVLLTDEFKDFFTQFGEVKEHQIMRDHSTNRSRGFGFITFESELAVDDLLAKGNRLELAGAQVIWFPNLYMLVKALC